MLLEVERDRDDRVRGVAVGARRVGRRARRERHDRPARAPGWPGRPPRVAGDPRPVGGASGRPRGGRRRARCVVSPPGKRSFSSAWTSVDSASAGRKLSVSSLVTSASLRAERRERRDGDDPAAITTHFVRRPATNEASARIAPDAIGPLGRRSSLGTGGVGHEPPAAGDGHEARVRRVRRRARAVGEAEAPQRLLAEHEDRHAAVAAPGAAGADALAREVEDASARRGRAGSWGR